MRFTLWNLLTVICFLCQLIAALGVAIGTSADITGFIVASVIGIGVGGLWITVMRIVGSKVAVRIETTPIQFQTICNGLFLSATVGFIFVTTLVSDRVTTNVLKILSSRGL